MFFKGCDPIPVVVSSSCPILPSHIHPYPIPRILESSALFEPNFTKKAWKALASLISIFQIYSKWIITTAQIRRFNLHKRKDYRISVEWHKSRGLLLEIAPGKFSATHNLVAMLYLTAAANKMSTEAPSVVHLTLCQHPGTPSSILSKGFLCGHEHQSPQDHDVEVARIILTSAGKRKKTRDLMKTFPLGDSRMCQECLAVLRGLNDRRSIKGGDYALAFPSIALEVA